MANPYAGGTEKNKLFTFASSVKGNTDKASVLFAETNVGKGLFDVSGGSAVPQASLPKSSAAATGHSSAR